MVRPLKRNQRTAVLGGVAAGLGDYFDVDPVLMRLGFVLLTFASAIGLLFYVICWVIMPTDDARGVHPSAADNVVKDVRAAGEKVASDVRLISVLRGRLDTIVGADSDRYLAGVSVEVSEKQRDGAIRVLEPSVENGANRFQVWLNDRLSEGLGKTQECQDHRHAEHLSPPHRLHGTHGCLFYGFVGVRSSWSCSYSASVRRIQSV